MFDKREDNLNVVSVDIGEEGDGGARARTEDGECTQKPEPQSRDMGKK